MRIIVLRKAYANLLPGKRSSRFIMATIATYRRRLIRRKTGSYSITVPRELAEALDCDEVMIRARLDADGLLIEPILSAQERDIWRDSN